MSYSHLQTIVYGILVGDTQGDIISRMRWSDGNLRILHDREYEGFPGVRYGQSLRPEDVVSVQAFQVVSDELIAAGFAVVDDIKELSEKVRS